MMSKPLSANDLVERARAEITLAQVARDETDRLGRTAGRTTRLRAAMGRAGRLLDRAVQRGLSARKAREIYESGPDDPEYGRPQW